MQNRQRYNATESGKPIEQKAQYLVICKSLNTETYPAPYPFSSLSFTHETHAQEHPYGKRNQIDEERLNTN